MAMTRSMSCKVAPPPGKRRAHPWTTAVIQPPPKTFVARPRPAMRATKAQVLNAIHDPATTIIETRRQQNIAEAGGTVQGAFWLPSTTVYASNGCLS